VGLGRGAGRPMRGSRAATVVAGGGGEVPRGQRRPHFLRYFDYFDYFRVVGSLMTRLLVASDLLGRKFASFIRDEAPAESRSRLDVEWETNSRGIGFVAGVEETYGVRLGNCELFY
jgi:hypothetical protein